MSRHIVSLIVICASFAVMPLAASAVPITVPTDLNPGDTYRLAFVTSATEFATSSNIADYNAFVTGVANGVPQLAALGTTWTAIGSTSTVDARDNTGTNPSSTGVPIYRLDDMRIADNNADLWSGGTNALQNPLNTTETNGLAPLIAPWTGSLGDGTARPNNFLGSGSIVQGGNTSSTTVSWILGGQLSDSLSLPFYAMSGEITIVPEPSTMVLVFIGAIAAVGWQIRRRLGRKT